MCSSSFMEFIILHWHVSIKTNNQTPITKRTFFASLDWRCFDSFYELAWHASWNVSQMFVGLIRKKCQQSSCDVTDRLLLWCTLSLLLHSLNCPENAKWCTDQTHCLQRTCLLSKTVSLGGVYHMRESFSKLTIQLEYKHKNKNS